MKNLIALAATISLSMAPLLVTKGALAQQTSSQQSAQAAAATASIVHAANDYLATLSPEQRKKVVYPFDDNVQRTNWSNLPTGTVVRGGLSLAMLTLPQRAAMFKVMSTVLSPMGFEKINEIRESDDDFRVWNPDGHGVFGEIFYHMSFLGMPSTTQPWMIKIDGHHVAVNITIDGNKGVLVPMLTGAAPASFKLNGKEVRPLGRESDKGLVLIESMDTPERRKAVLPYYIGDLVLGPGQDGKKIAPEGIKATDLYPTQKEMLLDLISEWVNVVNGPYAAPRMAQIKAELDDTYFAWAGRQTGGVGTNIDAYFRIQGPHLIIEYSPQPEIQPPPPGRQSKLTNNHVHTIYRDPTNDYGSAMLKP